VLVRPKDIGNASVMAIMPWKGDRIDGRKRIILRAPFYLSGRTRVRKNPNRMVQATEKPSAWTAPMALVARMENTPKVVSAERGTEAGRLPPARRCSVAKRA